MGICHARMTYNTGMNTPLTASQTKALDTLRAQAALGFPNRTTHGDIATGVNTTTLWNLRGLGLISVSRVFLRGHVTADLQVLA